MAALGVFRTLPRPDPRETPEIPPILPWTPKPPDMPELPPLIPFPPDFDWPDVNPWIPQFGAPSCYRQFADRLMRLIYATAVFRASVGLNPAWPPGDLRTFSYPSAPMTNLFIAWFVTMWNTIAVDGASGLLTLAATAGSDDAYMRSDRPTTLYTYNDALGFKWLQAGRVAVGAYAALGVIMRDVQIPRGSTITSATYYAGMHKPVTNLGSGNFDTKVFASLAQPTTLGFDTYSAFLALHNTPTVLKADFDVVVPANSSAVWHGPDVTAIIQEVVNHAAWNPGQAITMFVSDYEQKQSTYYLATKANESTGSPKPYLSVQFTNPDVSVPQVPLTSIVRLDEWACPILNSWLTMVEGIAWPRMGVA